jgi:hypothetical protein
MQSNYASVSLTTQSLFQDKKFNHPLFDVVLLDSLFSHPLSEGPSASSTDSMISHHTMTSKRHNMKRLFNQNIKRTTMFEKILKCMRHEKHHSYADYCLKRSEIHAISVLQEGIPTKWKRVILMSLSLPFLFFLS